jgi:hypothetical protein
MSNFNYRVVMNKLLKKFAGTNVNTDNILFTDYKNLDPSITKEQIDIRKVRGSVRLQTGRIATEVDVQELFDKVMGTPLPLGYEISTSK